MKNKEYNIEKLEEFLRDHNIPEIKANPKTFLGIAKQPHYENVLSNIYAFYFNPSEEHGLNDLFIMSFVDLINEKTEGKFEISNDFDVFTEVSTKKGGRIDLLLQNEEKAIIIENKVNHYLNNDLDDYWNSTEPNTKKAVVLSLKKIHQILPIDDSDKVTYPKPYPFINITHLEFLDEVMKKSGDYLLNATDKYIIFLKDLYQNIINLSNQMETKNIQFYYNHQEKLNDIAKLKFAVRDHIAKEVELACNLVNTELKIQKVFLNKPRGDNGKRLRYYKLDKNEELMFTIIFDGLLSSKRTLLFIVELNGSALNDKGGYKSIEFNENEKKDNVLNEDFYESKGYWAHFASKESDKLSDSDIEKLSEYIASKLKESSLISIFEKLELFLANKGNKN